MSYESYERKTNQFYHIGNDFDQHFDCVKPSLVYNSWSL